MLSDPPHVISSERQCPSTGKVFKLRPLEVHSNGFFEGLLGTFGFNVGKDGKDGKGGEGGVQKESKESGTTKAPSEISEDGEKDYLNATLSSSNRSGSQGGPKVRASAAESAAPETDDYDDRLLHSDSSDSLNSDSYAITANSSGADHQPQSSPKRD